MPALDLPDQAHPRYLEEACHRVVDLRATLLGDGALHTRGERGARFRGARRRHARGPLGHNCPARWQALLGRTPPSNPL